MLRSHTCGQLRSSDIGQQVTLCGWVDSTRDYGGMIFIDLRDRYGKTQVVVTPDSGDENLEIAKRLRGEDVALFTGTVASRLEGKDNEKLATGGIEVRASKLQLLNRCKTPPFFPNQEEMPGEDLRLRYRYIDLRREQMQRTLVLRSAIIKTMRDYFADNDFIDVETPILGRSTPEGARDYLVPSRVHWGHFFALPQSPQLYKQILMVAGYDRYVQIARCFRDEDLRADRQPEFTQLDMEMSFVDAEDGSRAQRPLGRQGLARPVGSTQQPQQGQRHQAEARGKRDDPWDGALHCPRQPVYLLSCARARPLVRRM